MCIIIAKPAGSPRPSSEIIARCFNANPDGAGIMYPNVSKQLTVVKGLMTLEAFMEEYAAIKNDHIPFVAHFRIATHGIKDASNTHPFFTVKDMEAICHNGVLPCSALVEKDSGLSDTAYFAKHILSKLPNGWQKIPAFVHILQHYMGTFNKVVHMDADGKITILNRAQGTESGGVWYSNSGFQPPATYNYPAIGMGNGVNGAYNRSFHEERDDDYGNWNRGASSHRSQTSFTDSLIKRMEAVDLKDPEQVNRYLEIKNSSSLPYVTRLVKVYVRGGALTIKEGHKLLKLHRDNILDESEVIELAGMVKDTMWTLDRVLKESAVDTSTFREAAADEPTIPDIEVKSDEETRVITMPTPAIDLINKAVNKGHISTADGQTLINRLATKQTTDWAAKGLLGKLIESKLTLAQIEDVQGVRKMLNTNIATGLSIAQANKNYEAEKLRKDIMAAHMMTPREVALIVCQFHLGKYTYAQCLEIADVTVATGLLVQEVVDLGIAGAVLKAKEHKAKVVAAEAKAGTAN